MRRPVVASLLCIAAVPAAYAAPDCAGGLVPAPLKTPATVIAPVAPEFTATAANVGYGWWSHDLGGFARGMDDDELYVRWLQFGCFSPVFRLHNCGDQTLDYRPWSKQPAVRDAALAVGASKMQTVFHHVLPLALPGILTGAIIGMARALGETAPLLMIGMRAFVSTPPAGLTDPSSVLPMQIFLWSDEVDRAFVQNTSAAIIVLLVFLLAMNGLAIYLRNKFETRW